MDTRALLIEFVIFLIELRIRLVADRPANGCRSRFVVVQMVWFFPSIGQPYLDRQCANRRKEKNMNDSLLHLWLRWEAWHNGTAREQRATGVIQRKRPVKKKKASYKYRKLKCCGNVRMKSMLFETHTCTVANVIGDGN